MRTSYASVLPTVRMSYAVVEEHRRALQNLAA